MWTSNNQDPLALVLGLHFDTCVHVKGSAIIKECEKLEWPLVSWTSIISASTWPKFKSKVSFEILRTSRFQNWPYFLNFVKIWLRYCQKQNWEIFRTTLYNAWSEPKHLTSETVTRELGVRVWWCDVWPPTRLRLRLRHKRPRHPWSQSDLPYIRH